MAEEPSMMQMLKQARGLQKQMKQIQKKVEKRDVAATVAGGKVEVVCSGKLVIKRILIDQSLLDAPDKRTLQDALVTGVNAAIKKAQDIMNVEMARMAGDMGIPADELTGGAGGDDERDDDDTTTPDAGGRLKRWFKRS